MTDVIVSPPVVTEMTSADIPAVNVFISRVPRGEYLFLKEDLGNPDVIDSWRTRHGSRVLIATAGDEVAGLLAVIPGLGWSAHVGELRLVVAPEWRGKGIGAALARRGLQSAVDSGLMKLTTEVLSDQSGVISLFNELGFVGEALLTDQARDETGQLHDILVLAHPVIEAWSSATMLGVGDEGSTR
ncbi:GNAT family N-acetyltransferase [Nocardia sp. 348MFTsu5.1]|uniref:GNAT family N-acetyltransferase n=1 Tax=Nocardia sp. 348MFTsu5.1 TaxID=1172185 RepID=UPI0003A46984|nr:GNAT family N-acetyltransferase [Nocardia sp. 348MFTsu5.1]